MRLLKESAIYAAANFPGSEEGETVLRRVRTLPSQPDAQSSGRRTDGHTYIRTYSTRSFSTRRSAESSGGDVAPARSFSTGVTDRAITAPVPLPKAVSKELLLAKNETRASKHDEIQPVEETINQKRQQRPQVLTHLKVLLEEPVAEKDGSTKGAEKLMDNATERVKEDEPVASSTGKHAEESEVAEEPAVADAPQMQSVATDCKDHSKLKSARMACKRLMQMRNATMASNIRLRKLKWVLLSHRRVLMWHIGSLRERNHELLERNQELETVLQEVLLQHGEVPRLEETLRNAESTHFPMENNVLAHVQHGKQNVDENRASGEEEEGGARGGEEEEEGGARGGEEEEEGEEGADDRGGRGGGVEYRVSSREGGASLEQYLALKKRGSRQGASERAVPKERLREREVLLQDLVSAGSKLAYGKESVSGSFVHQRMQMKAEAGEGQSISWKDWNGARGLLKSLSFQERLLKSSESFSEKETSTSRTERKHRRGGSLEFPQETEKMPFKTQEEISPSTSERNVNTVPSVRYRSQEMARDDPLYREASEWTELRSTEATSDDGSMQLEDTEDEEDYALVQKEIEWLRSSRERDLTEVNQRIADLEVQLSGANTQRLEAFRVLMAMKLQAEQLAIFLANTTSSPKSSMSDSVLRSTRAKALELETAVVFGNQASRRTSRLIPQMEMEAIKGGVSTLEEEPFTMNEGEEYIAVTADEMRSLKRALLAQEAAKKAGKGEKSRLASSSDEIKSVGREEENTYAVGSHREDPERGAPAVAYPNSNHMNDDTDVIMHNSTDGDEAILQNQTNIDEAFPNRTGSWENASDALETIVTTEIRDKASSSLIPESDVDPDDLFDLMWMGGKKK